MIPVKNAAVERAANAVTNSISAGVSCGKLATIIVTINARMGAVSSSGMATTGRQELSRLNNEPATIPLANRLRDLAPLLGQENLVLNGGDGRIIMLNGRK